MTKGVRPTWIEGNVAVVAHHALPSEEAAALVGPHAHALDACIVADRGAENSVASVARQTLAILLRLRRVSRVCAFGKGRTENKEK